MEAPGPGIVKRSLKIAAIAFALVVAVIGIAATLAEPFVNSATVKAGIEKSLSDASGLRVRIKGKIDLAIFPAPSVAANNVAVSSGNTDIVSVARIEINPRFPDMPISSIQLRSVALHRPTFTVDSELIDEVSTQIDDHFGTLVPVDSLVIESFAVYKATFRFAGHGSDLALSDFYFKGSRLAVIEDRKLAFDDIESFVRKVRFNGEASAKQIVSQDIKLTDIKARIRTEEGILTFEPVELVYFGARSKIAGHFDVLGNPKHLKIQIEVPEAYLEDFLQGSESAGMAAGAINVKADLEATAARIPDLPNHLRGSLSVKGRDLTLRGVNLDKALTEFKKITGYGFSDLSALVLMGPVGLIVSNGYDQLTALYKIMEASGDSTIRQIVSDWRVSDGVLTAADVAFSTQRHRVAIKGRIDLANSRYDDITIAIVDANGCILNSETVNGPFAAPEVKDSGLMQRTLIRPLEKLLNPECKLFYDGSLPHPAAQ